MATFSDFHENLSLPTEGQRIITSRIPRIRRWHGMLAGRTDVLLAASPAALANRGPA